jgi:hypothetical protein
MSLILYFNEILFSFCIIYSSLIDFGLLTQFRNPVRKTAIVIIVFSGGLKFYVKAFIQVPCTHLATSLWYSYLE